MEGGGAIGCVVLVKHYHVHKKNDDPDQIYRLSGLAVHCLPTSHKKDT